MNGIFDRLNDIRIWARLVAAILAAIVLMWVGFLSWAAYEQRQLAVDQARDFAVSVHQMTMAGLTGMMISGTIGTRALFLDQIKRANHVEAIKVFRSPALVAQYGPGREGEAPGDIDEKGVLDSGKAYFEVVRRDGDERLRAIIPAVALENYLGKNCLNCHHVPAGTVLGAVSMEISLDRANAAVGEFARSASIAAALFCIPLGLLIWYFSARLVTRPLEEMTDGLKRIAEGNIEEAHVLARRGNDEIGQATQAFNAVMSKAYELLREQRLSRIVFDNALEGITVTDARSRIQMVNRAFTETTGYTFEEVIGQTPALLKSGRQGDDFYQDFWKTLSETGEWRGEIWNKRKNGTVYPEWLNVSAVRNRDGTVEHYIAIFSDITERKQREELITFQAFHDALTGLPNRILFRDRLDQALTMAKRQKYRTPTVMFLDLDRFKQINDTLGHDAGDELLKEVARRLRACVRESDTVARMGGDEFTILLPEVGDVADAKAVGAKILDAMKLPMTLSGTEVFITTSIGVSLFPKDGRDPDTLMKHADAAMYQVKGSGRAGICFFAAEMVGLPSRRLEIESGLSHALERGEFHLHYQPIVDLADQRIVMQEALLRWAPAPGDVRLPEDFLGIAEESGLTADLGLWVVDTACRQAVLWRAQGHDQTVAINLSARQFQRVDLARGIASALERSGLPATGLEIEIGETLAMRDADSTIRNFSALAELGVRLAIDDYGTGFTSLANLARMPVETIKIDRSVIRNLIHDPASRAIVESAIATAHAFGRLALAEGVETAEQADLLRRLGCDRAQGFLFAAPTAVAVMTVAGGT